MPTQNIPDEIKQLFNFFLLFFSIGITVYLTGCNPNVPGGCISYNKFHGHIYRQILDPEYDYAYNNGYVYLFAINNNNETCIVKIRNDAYNTMLKYPIGTHVNWLKNKHDGNCQRADMITWYAAIILILISFIWLSCFYCVSNEHRQRTNESRQRYQPVPTTVELI